MDKKSKFFELDMKPVCKRCHDKFPDELKKRMKKTQEKGTSGSVISALKSMMSDRD